MVPTALVTDDVKSPVPSGRFKSASETYPIAPDLPVLSETGETTLPGLYIAGELGGLALIRNAVNQGARVVEEIHRGFAQTPPNSSQALDLLIVGAGPAGLAASLKATELGLNYLTIDQDSIGGTVSKYPRRKLTMTERFTLPLYGRVKKHEFVKEELVELFSHIIETYALEIRSGVKFLGLERKRGGFVSRTSAGVVASRSVLLALGRRGTPRRLGVPGEESEKVLYQLVDASSYCDERILVVGGGDSAIEAATALANQRGNQVVLSYRKPSFFRLKRRNEERLEEYVSNRRVRVMLSSEVERIEEERVLLRVEEESGATRRVALASNYVFVFAGGDPPYPLLQELGVEFGGDGISTSSERQTRARVGV